MAFTGNFLTNLARQSFLKGIHRSGDTYKLALYTNTASFTATTTQYTATNEVTGTGYVAGGFQLTGFDVQWDASNTRAYLDFGNAVWDATGGALPTTGGARGALLYNTNSLANGGILNEVIAVLDFGADKQASNASFTVTIPTAGETGIVRF